MSIIYNSIKKYLPDNSPDRFKLIYLVLAVLCLVLVLSFSITVIRRLSDKHLIYGIQNNSEKIADSLIYTEVEAITITEEQGVINLGVTKEYFDSLDDRIRDIFDQMQILKVVMYNKSGRVIYSTDKQIIGAIEQDNSALKKALAGNKQLIIQNTGNATDLMGERRTGVSIAEAYTPVFQKDNLVIGVVAVYSDVSTQIIDYRRQLWISISILVAAILLVSLLSYIVIIRASLELKKAYNLLENYAKTDALTGVYNRGELIRQAEEFFLIMQRSREKLMANVGIGIVMIDLDYFKQVNDSYGHLVGDHVLQSTTERIGSVLRSYDLLGRFGGEEFMIVLPNTTAEEVHVIAERALESIARVPIKLGELTIPLTASMGATWGDAVKENLENVIHRADELLYEAKNRGRNRVVFKDIGSK